ncbi:MAG: hypothetical protein HY567_03255 [Candidatus Kerfeldbacteria bacterium]|nr:hypothetical protein [Candidatus Kerfeldbacteria bacterium]
MIDFHHNRSKAPRPQWFAPVDRQTNERLARTVVWLVTATLATNQFLIASISPKSAGASPLASLKSMLGMKTASAMVIVGPKLNSDGKTTSLVQQPTISSVPANPKSGDDLTDAKAVMLATGRPPYAPDGVSFDDPINAQNVWVAYEQSITLSGSLETRYNNLINGFTCNYCCGEAAIVTRNRQCGCAHAKAARGFFKYMLQTFGDQYSDEQLMGEAFRWQAIWYPKGAVEDYLLATGKANVIGHAPHGGAGADNMHGLTT